MQRLIEDLTLFNQTTRTEKTPAVVDLRLLLNRVLERLNSTIVDRAATIEDSFPQVGEAVVWGDEVNLGLVLQNLIDNATKFVPPDRTPVVRLSALPCPGGWAIEVADNGIGIESRFFGKIFQLFQRLHDRETFAGTGVGLAIAKEIVDAHGGTLTVVSAPGAGSTFQVSLHSCASSPSYSATR
jgi:signal transduction histidine kinase